MSNNQLQEDQVAGIVSDKGPLAGEDDPDLLRSLRTKLNTTDFWPSLLKILSSSVFQSMHFVFSSYQNLYYKN